MAKDKRKKKKLAPYKIANLKIAIPARDWCVLLEDEYTEQDIINILTKGAKTTLERLVLSMRGLYD